MKFILIVLASYNHTLSMQEFDDARACAKAAELVKPHAALVRCVPKSSTPATDPGPAQWM